MLDDNTLMQTHCLSAAHEDPTDCNCYQAGKETTELPCQGCFHCQRLHEQWARFEEDVGDVVPLVTRQITKQDSTVLPQQVGADHHCKLAATSDLPAVNIAQKDDPVLSILHSWKESGVLPTREEVTMESSSEEVLALLASNRTCQGVLHTASLPLGECRQR